MFLFNISYVIPAFRKQAFLQWAQGEGRKAAQSPLLCDFHVLSVVAIPGDKDFAKSPDRNLSLQMTFDSLADCREWHETRFDSLMMSYAAWYGKDPLFFATILKES